MPQYADTLTVRDARAQYFAANGFGDGGYTARWVKLKAGPVPIFLPNTAARVRAVRFHDVHHVLTQYDTTWTGEAEIAAWEIASSCAHHYAAWVLNLWGLAIGLCIDPRAVFRAFVRGRHTRNLYRRQFSESLLATTVGELRHELGLTSGVPEATPSDKATFLLWSLAGLGAFLLSTALYIVPIVALVVFILR